MRFAGLIVALVLICGAARADDVQQLLDRLATAETPQDAERLTGEIWLGWISGHADAPQKQMMQSGIYAMQARQLDAAERIFTQLIALNPDFVEAWNKRATVRFMAGDLDGSERDVAEVLSREPRHFGAISGLGLIAMQRGELRRALDAYEILLRVHPFSPDAQKLVPELRDRLGIDDI